MSVQLTECCRQGFAPPTVADTKRKFLEAYDKPIGAIYSGIVQELLVSQHFMRYNLKYAYDEVRRLNLKLNALIRHPSTCSRCS